MVINFDEWGGFFDHVRPHAAPDVSKQTALRGFRVPALVVSPHARAGHVDHRVYDHTSILKAIEWRWGLPPLTVRDKKAANIVHALDFHTPPRLTVPHFRVPPFVTAGCNAPNLPSEEGNEWADLRTLAVTHGWRLPS